MIFHHCRMIILSLAELVCLSVYPFMETMTPEQHDKFHCTLIYPFMDIIAIIMPILGNCWFDCVSLSVCLLVCWPMCLFVDTIAQKLNSNFSYVETHLATSFPNLFLLSEIQLSSQSSPDPLQISCYNLYSHFCSKDGVCTYCNISTPIAILMDLESPHSDISNELEQIIKHSTHVPDRHEHASSTLDLFFTSNPQNFTYTVSSPLGSCDHCTVSITSSFTPPPPVPPTQRHLWHFENTRQADMSNFLLDFPWNDYCFWTCDIDLAATAVGELVDSRMRAYITYSLKAFSPSNPWFDRACSSAISYREGAHPLYQASPFELTHATFISARNHCSAKIHRAHSSFCKRKIDKLNSSPTEKCFWPLSKNLQQLL